MSDTLVIETLLGLIAVGIGFAGYTFATRAHRDQAKAVQISVDAAAYGRAKEIWEGSVQELRQQIGDLRAETVRLKEGTIVLAENNSRLREEIAGLHTEVTALRARLG